MKKLTLDTNCIIDLEENRPNAKYIRRLIDAHCSGDISIALAKVSASERQKGDRLMENFAEFQDRVEAVGLGDLEQLSGIAFYGFGFWGHGYYGGTEDMTRLDEQIHSVLFPKIDYSYADFVSAIAPEDDAAITRATWKWRNAFCDRQMFWAHEYHNRDVFVSSDRNFKKLEGQNFCPSAVIFSPSEASASLLV